jgi:predicted transcriptional regulator
MDEPIGEVRERVRAAGWDVCVVTNDERIVMGLLREKQLGSGKDDDPIERVMRPGPSTFRPNVPIAEMADYLVEHDLPSSPITSSDGRLIGLLLREDAARSAHEEHLHHDDAEDGSA